MISIIIPVYNSEKTIEVLVDEIIKVLDKNYEYEVVLINDCSNDQSEEKCKNLVKKYAFVSLFSLSKNVGEHNAIMAGLNKCTGDYAVIMSDDLQNSAASLLELIKEKGFTNTCFLLIPSCALFIGYMYLFTQIESFLWYS